MPYLIALAVLLGIVIILQAYITRQERKKRMELEKELVRADSDRSHLLQERAEHSQGDDRKEGEIDRLATVTANLEERCHQFDVALQQKDQELAGLKATLAEYYSKELADKKLEPRIAALRAELSVLDEESNLRSFGHYRPHYDFADSARYQSKLEEILDAQKEMLKNKTAGVSDMAWTTGGRKEGQVQLSQKQISQILKLMLRAFNGECDAAIAKVHYNNVTVMEARINKTFEAINSLGHLQGCRITGEYLKLKLQELYLVHEYAEKVQMEKEEQRRIREQMRDEEIAQREFEKARQEAEAEERRYEMALQKAREEMEKTAGVKHDKLMEQIAAMEQKLAEAHANKERAISRAQMTRSGYVYIISNIGSFGERVFKIGMTRRLDPMDRVRELGDASVPFPFDVHALTFTQDAPALETALHNAFWERRINWVNDKREFFNVSIDEIVEVAKKHCGEIQITKVAEAEEYRKTLSIRSDQTATPRIA